MTKDSLQGFKDNIDKSYLIINRAINGYSDAIAYALQKLGKRATARWVRYQGERQSMRRSVFQESYKRWLCSYLMAGNIEGADLLINDLETFLRHVKRELGLCGSTLDTRAARELLIIREKVDSLLAA